MRCRPTLSTRTTRPNPGHELVNDLQIQSLRQYASPCGGRRHCRRSTVEAEVVAMVAKKPRCAQAGGFVDGDRCLSGPRPRRIAPSLRRTDIYSTAPAARERRLKTSPAVSSPCWGEMAVKQDKGPPSVAVGGYPDIRVRGTRSLRCTQPCCPARRGASRACRMPSKEMRVPCRFESVALATTLCGSCSLIYPRIHLQGPRGDRCSLHLFFMLRCIIAKGFITLDHVRPSLFNIVTYWLRMVARCKFQLAGRT